MTDSRNWWKKSRQLVTSLLIPPLRLLRQLNARNVKILWKAIRQEPPDLILANFAQFLKTGRQQSPYSEKFLSEDEVIKVQVQDCRKEKGVLMVIVWVLAKAGLREATLYAGTQKLDQETYTFEKPEFRSFFAEFSDFEQKGLIFQVPTSLSLSSIALELCDQNGHLVLLPIGSHFVYPSVAEIQPPENPDLAKRYVLLLHDWDLPLQQSSSNSEIITHLASLPDFEQTFILFTNPKRPIFLAESQLGKIMPVTFEQLQVSLRDLEFDYLLVLSIGVTLPAGFPAGLQAFCTQNPQADLIYFDEDLQENPGQYHSPLLKPEFSPERLARDNYIGANFCVSRAIGRQLDWFSPADLLSGAYDFLLRAMDITPHFHRLPEMRIHTIAFGQTLYENRTDHEEQTRRDHFTKLGWTVLPGLSPDSGEILRPQTVEPLVSIIIPFKDQIPLLDRCLQSILTKTHYTNFEVLLVSNNSEEAETYEYLDQCCEKEDRFRFLRWDQPFNYAQINNWAVRQAAGTILLLLNNDIEVITEGWLTNLLSYLEDPAVGGVGAKLLYPDNTVQHAGIIIGFGGIAAHAHKHYPDIFGGYDGRANKVQNVSACTAACLLLRRSAFEKAGGFDARHLPIAFNDVDLCLKIRELGYRIVYTPFVKLYHYESISRGAEDTPAKRKRARREVGFFRKKWKIEILSGDPYYHPGFSLRLGDFVEKGE